MFGNIARFHPKEVFEKYPTFMSLVFDLLSSSDVTLKAVAVETIGFVGREMEGKRALEKLGWTFCIFCMLCKDLIVVLCGINR